MKNLLFAGLAGVLTLGSCATKNGTGTTAKQAQTQRADFLKLKGEWKITSVDYDKSFRIKPFDEGADISCFVGSYWRFIPNNYSGSYVLNGGGDCPAVSQSIKIDMTGDHTFQFKKLQADVKAKSVISGYALQLTDQSADQFSLRQDVMFEGNTIPVVYHFQRTSSK